MAKTRSPLNKKLTSFEYVTPDQEKLHKFLISVMKAFTPEDVTKYKKDIAQFLTSPVLELEKSRHFTTKSQPEINYRQFATDVTFWLKTTFFRFTRKNVKALILKARQMKEQGLSSDDFLFVALSAVPTANTEYVPKPGTWLNKAEQTVWATKSDSYIPREHEDNSEHEMDEVIVYGSDGETKQLTVKDFLNEYEEYVPEEKPTKEKPELEDAFSELGEEEVEESISPDEQVEIYL